MKSFKQYLAESTRESSYAIKLAAEPTDAQLDAIESYLKRYDLIDISKPNKLLNDKVDFSNGANKHIWQITVAIGMPLSSYAMMQELKSALNIPEDYIVVRGSNEPIEIEANEDEFLGDVAKRAADKGLVPASRLSTDRFYDDAEQPLATNVFGDAYNKKFLDYLGKVADDRKTDHYEAPAPLFSWIDMDKVKDDLVVTDDFNKDYDTPKPVSKGKGKDTPPVEPVYLGHNGNFDDAVTTNMRLMKDKNGKREAISAPRARLNAGKVR
jgi:hypothetical protein